MTLVIQESRLTQTMKTQRNPWTQTLLLHALTAVTLLTYWPPYFDAWFKTRQFQPLQIHRLKHLRTSLLRSIVWSQPGTMSRIGLRGEHEVRALLQMARCFDQDDYDGARQTLQARFRVLYIARTRG